MFEYVMTFPCEVKPGSIADVHERIIRCKDCVYYDETPIYTEASSELSTENCHMFSYFDIPYPVEANGFCYLGTPKGVE